MSIIHGIFGKILYMFALGTVVLITLPLIVVIAAAFNPYHLVFPPEGFSFVWFIKLLHEPHFMSSIKVSAILGLLSSALSTLMGISAAIGLRYAGQKVKDAVSGIMLAPLFVPTVVTGLALYQLSYITFSGKQPWMLLLGHILISIPFPLRNIVASLEGVPLSADEAAMNVGARPSRIVWKILLPLIKPGIFSGWVMAFIVSWNDFNISLFLASPGYNPLGVQIYNYIMYQYEPTVAAMSACMIAVACAVVLVLNKFVGLTGLTEAR